MPQYWFMISGDKAGSEPAGYRLPDLEAAKCEAARTIGMIICDAGPGVWGDEDWSIAVADETGLVLFTLLIVATESPALQPMSVPSPARRLM